ncbi:MAG TPA: family 78 glycoside hydrolase catalytic domain [Trebonia sp.]|nr:family 78 glycoside hydrolase catalytic domain [Trebonia sp.]
MTACLMAVAAISGVAATLARAQTVPGAPTHLQVNLVTNPMAVPLSGTHFSWVTQDPRAGESQQGYEIRVATSPSTVTSGKAKWDSGEVRSANPYGPYNGPALASASRYWWTVRTFDAQGNPGPWAAPAEFGTALSLSASAIWSKPVNGKNSGWAFLRGTLKVANKPVLSATVYASAASTAPGHQWVFRLSVNGHVIGVGPVPSPVPSSVTEYSSWDVTSLLAKGSTDTFGALAFTQLDQQFVLQVVIQYTDGSRTNWGTGSGWQAMDGGSVYPSAGSVGTSYYYAPVEDLNAEKYPFGFDTPSFNASRWTAPVIKKQIRGLTPLPIANVTLAQHYPKSVKRLGSGHYLIDFGTTQVGGLRLYVDGKAGQKVTIRYGEVLASPTSVKYKLSTGNVYQDVYTLRGGVQNLMIWGFRTFRYVEVIGSPSVMTTSTTVDTAVVYPDQPSQSAMTSSSAQLNEVWNFTKQSVEDLNMYLYLDPARERTTNDEGDSYIHQQSQAAIGDDSAEGRYSTLVALKFMAGDPESIMEYRELAPVAALASWWQTGDASALAGLYPNLQQMLLPVGSNGLVNIPITSLVRNDAVFGQPGQPAPDIPEASGIGTGPLSGAQPQTTVPGDPTTLVDWPPNERDGFVFERENTIVNAFAYAAYNAMAQIAAATGKTSNASAYAADAAALKAAIQSDLYDPATGAFYDGIGTSHQAIQSSIYVVALGAASPAQAQAAARFVAKHGITPTACSVYCAAYMLQALYDGGQAQAALNVLTSDSSTSWLNMIAQGAGSTMEAWNPSIKGNLSYSHAWATSPDFVVPEYLFGISPLTPGWSSILIHPQPGDLTSGSVTMPTARGQVRVAFTQPSGGAFTATVTIPATASGEVALPGVSAGQQVLVDGTAVTATALQAPSGQTVAVVPVSSGAHTVAAA